MPVRFLDEPAAPKSRVRFLDESSVGDDIPLGAAGRDLGSADPASIKGGVVDGISPGGGKISTRRWINDLAAEKAGHKPRDIDVRTPAGQIAARKQRMADAPGGMGLRDFHQLHPDDVPLRTASTDQAGTYYDFSREGAKALVKGEEDAARRTAASIATGGADQYKAGRVGMAAVTHLSDVAGAAGRLVGIPESDEINRNKAAMDQMLGEKAGEGHERTIQGLAGSFAGMAGGAPLAAFAPAGMGAHVINLSLGAAAVDQSITRGRDAGLTGTKLATYALANGAAEAVPAMVMNALGMPGAEAIFNKTAGRALSEATKRAIATKVTSKFAAAVGQGTLTLGIGALSEVPEEVTTTWLQHLNESVHGQPTGDLTEQIADTIVQSFLMGGIGNVPQALSGSNAADDGQPAGKPVAPPVVAETPAEPVTPAKPQRIPTEAATVREWATSNPTAAAPLIEAAKSGKPLSQSMMNPAGLYRGKAAEREALAKELATIDPTELVNLAAIDETKADPAYVGKKPTKSTEIRDGDMVTLKPGEYGIVRESGDKRFLAVETDAGIVPVDRREVTSHRPLNRQPVAEQDSGPSSEQPNADSHIPPLPTKQESPREAPAAEPETRLPPPEPAATQAPAQAAVAGQSSIVVDGVRGEIVNRLPTGEVVARFPLPDGGTRTRIVPQQQGAAPAAQPPAVDAAFPVERRAELQAAVKARFGEDIEFVEPTAENADAVAFYAARGIPVRFYKSKPGINRPIPGFTEDETKVVFMNAAGPKGNPLWNAIGHEWAHASGADERLADLPEEVLIEARKEYAKNANPKYRKWLNDHPDVWTREAAATYVGRLMGDPAFRAKLEGDDPALWRKIWDAIRQLIGDYKPLDDNARRVLEELTVKQADADIRQANRKPLPPQFASLSDEELRQVLVNMKVIKDDSLAKKKKPLTRETLEDLTNQTFFGATPPPIMRFEKPAEPAADQPLNGLDESEPAAPAAVAQPASQEGGPSVPAAKDEFRAVEPEAASNASVEAPAAKKPKAKAKKPDEFAQPTKRKRERRDRAAELKAVAQKIVGDDPADILEFTDMIDHLWREVYDAHVEREAAKKAARQASGLTAGKINRAEDSYKDYTGKKNFDVFAEDAANNPDYASLGIDPNDPARSLWDILKEGVIDPPEKTDQAYVDEAAEMFRGMRDTRLRGEHDYPEDFTDIDAPAGDGAGVPGGDAETGSGEDGGGVSPDRSGVYDEGEIAVQGEGDADFEFGANAKPDEFGLAREPSKRTVKEKFEDAPAEQGKMFSGMDALPGQNDLFEDLDGPKYSLKKVRLGKGPLTGEDLAAMFPGAKIKRHWYTKNLWRVVLPNGVPLNVEAVDKININWPAYEQALGRKVSAEDRKLYQAAGAVTLTLPSGATTNPWALVQLAQDLADAGTLKHEAWHVASELGLITAAERDALVSRFSSPEKSRVEQDEDIAEAREAWAGPKGLGARIANWVRNLVRRLGLGKLLNLKADDVFALMQTPEFWSRQPQRMLEGTFYQLKKMTPEYLASLANPGTTPGARSAIDEQRMGQERETRPDDAVFAEADARLQEPDKVYQRLIDHGNRGTFADDADAVAVNRLINEKFAEITPDDPQSLRDFLAAVDAGDRKRSEWGRIGRQMRDPVETPEQRRARILGEAITSPSPKLREKIDNEIEKANEEGRAPKLEPIREEQVKQTQKLLGELEKIGVTPQNIGTIAKNPKIAHEAIRTVQSHRADVSDKVFEYWINAILSGIPTQSRNIAGTVLNAGWYFTGEKMAEVAINSMVRKPKGAQLGEMKHAFAGMIGSLGEAGRNFITTWRDEIDAFDHSMSATTGEQPFDRPASIKGKKGRVIRSFTRAMRAVDAWNKTVIAHGVAAERAYRQAKEEGKSGKDLSERMNQLLLDPESVAWREAVGKAKELAFQQRGGKTNRMVKRTLDPIQKAPGGRYLIPFKNTMVNIFATGLNKTPLGIATTISKMRAGKTEHITEDLARNALSMAFMAMLWAQDEDDPWITGSDGIGGTGKHRFSIRFPGTDTWSYYGFLEPFATAAGYMVDASRGLKSKSPVEMAKRILTSTTEQIGSKTFSSALGDVVEAISDPRRTGTILSEAGANFVVSWIPNVIRSTSREWDDELQNRRMRGQDAAEYATRLGKRILQNSELGLQDVIDGLEDFPRYDIWGDAHKRSQSPIPHTDLLWRLLAPVSTTSSEPFVGDQFLAAWKNEHPDDVDTLLFPARPSYSLGGTTRSMTDAQEAQYLKFSGQVAKRLISLGKYDPKKPTEQQWKAFQDDFTEARKVAKEMLVEQWNGGKPARLDSDEVAKALLRKNRIRAYDDLRLLSNADRSLRRDGESTLEYRERIRKDTEKRSAASELIKRTKG